MKKIYIDRLVTLKKKRNVSYDTMQEALGISASTLCRYFNGDAEPTMDTLERILEYLGGSMRELYADVGEAEMKAAEKVAYHGTDALLEDFRLREEQYKKSCEERLAHAAEMRLQLQQSFESALSTLERAHASALAKRDETYERTTAYLKELVIELRADNKELRERSAAAETSREHMHGHCRRVFWGMLSAVIALAVLLTVYIVIDAPQIGAGW